MIKIHLSNAFNLEKEYIVKTLLESFLGLQISIEYHSDGSDYYRFFLDNGTELWIRDSFFASVTDDSYLREKYIPSTVFQETTLFSGNLLIPIIFGHNHFTIDSNRIICEIDLIGSAFYMLTRWEEYVQPIRDELDRFPASAALAFKAGFLDRPIVNDYTEILWNMLRHLGYNHNRKSRDFQFLITHDVDIPFREFGVKDRFRRFSSALFKNGRPGAALTHLLQPNAFDFFMSNSERINTKSHFYFMTGGSHHYDFYYDIRHPSIQKLLHTIDKRGHIIGFHPSYETFRDDSLWQLEKNTLDRLSAQKIETGRQHFLRFEIPTTWQIWEKNNMKISLSMAYPDHDGFRCGTCYNFHPFDIINRKVMSLTEIPITIMENTLIGYRSLSEEEILDTCRKYAKMIKCYRGTFVLLWHNHLLTGYRKLYTQILDIIQMEAMC